jgi:hypothetical protein
MRQRASIGIALLTLSHLAFANASSALAQAGSTGGTIGKRDKSISGGEEVPSSRAPIKPQHANAPNVTCSLAKVWVNRVSDGRGSIWTITADGTATEQGRGNAQGHATLSGHTLIITWRISISNGNYVVHLNKDCTSGSGKTTVLGGVAAGDVLDVTFTAAQ